MKMEIIPVIASLLFMIALFKNYKEHLKEEVIEFLMINRTNTVATRMVLFEKFSERKLRQKMLEEENEKYQAKQNIVRKINKKGLFKLIILKLKLKRKI